MEREEERTGVGYEKENSSGARSGHLMIYSICIKEKKYLSPKTEFSSPMVIPDQNQSKAVSKMGVPRSLVR